jgi:hypothetical protein
MAWTNKHRNKSHVARKIRYRVGESAYQRFKKTGHVPAGLNSMQPRSRKYRSKKFPQGKRRRTTTTRRKRTTRRRRRR